jgi:hypothetical protein
MQRISSSWLRVLEFVPLTMEPLAVLGVGGKFSSLIGFFSKLVLGVALSRDFVALKEISFSLFLVFT